MIFSYFFIGIFSVFIICFAANRSAFYILRKKELPSHAAKDMHRILFAAFCVIYLFPALFCLLFIPYASKLVSSLAHLQSHQAAIVAPASVSPASEPTPHAVPVEMPQGRMSAEKERHERQIQMATAVAEQSRAIEERRLILNLEHRYVVSEAIVGTTENDLPTPELHKPDPSTEAKVSVQELVLVSAAAPSPTAAKLMPETAQNSGLAAWPVQQKNIAAEAPVQEVVVSSEMQSGNALPVVAVINQAPAPQIELQKLVISSTLQSNAPQVAPAMQQISAPVQPALPVEQSAVQNLPCEAIKSYMDKADLDVLTAKAAKQINQTSSWKGLRGLYFITPTAIKGSCKEYKLQANIQGQLLNCYQSCQAAVDNSSFDGNIITDHGNDKNVINNAMDDVDIDRLVDIFEFAHGVTTDSWVNPRSGNQYTVRMISINGPCREFNVEAVIHGKSFHYNESNCD